MEETKQQFAPYLAEHVDLKYHTGNILELNDPHLINQLIHRRLFFYEECYNDDNYGLLYLLQQKFNQRNGLLNFQAFRERVLADKGFIACLNTEEKRLMAGFHTQEPFNYLPQENLEYILSVKYLLFNLRKELNDQTLTTSQISNDFLPREGLNLPAIRILRKVLVKWDNKQVRRYDIPVHIISTGGRPIIRMYFPKLPQNVAQQQMLTSARLHTREYFIKYANSTSIDNRAIFYLFSTIHSENAALVEANIHAANPQFQFDYSKVICLKQNKEE